MNFDDLKDQLMSLLGRIGDRLHDSSTYTQLKERFDNLSPSLQKISVLAVGGLLYLALLSLPWSWYSETEETVVHFDERRNLVRELLKVSRESQDVPDIPMPPPLESLRSDIEERMKQANLIPEQIKSVEMDGGSTRLIPADKASGSLTVNLWKLNVRQIADVGARLTQINPSIKLTSTVITANSEDRRYFDMVVKMTALAVPDLSAPTALPEEPPTRKGGPSRSKNKGDE